MNKTIGGKKMDVNQASEILKKKKELEEKEKLARETVAREKEKKDQEQLESERERKRQENIAFQKRIPKEFCRPYCQCWSCKKEIQLTNEKGIETFNIGNLRTQECPHCRCFNIDQINLDGSENMDELLPYVLKMRR